MEVGWKNSEVSYARLMLHRRRGGRPGARRPSACSSATNASSPSCARPREPRCRRACAARASAALQSRRSCPMLSNLHPMLLPRAQSSRGARPRGGAARSSSKALNLHLQCGQGCCRYRLSVRVVRAKQTSAGGSAAKQGVKDSVQNLASDTGRVLYERAK